MSKTALITGGSKRIGKSIALKLAELNYNIALHYNSSQDEAELVKEEISKKGVKCKLYKCDLSRESEVVSLIPKVIKEFKSIELLINNASLFVRSNMKNTTLDIYNKTMDTNLKTPFILMQYFAKNTKNGHIINLIDTKISKNDYVYFVYTLAKKSLADMTLMSAKELGPNVRVNGICPGLILPPEGKDNDYLNKIANKTPLKKVGSTKDIVNAIEFLINNEYLTGQLIYADGGQHL